MAAKPKVSEPAQELTSDSLVVTESQLAAMSDSEKQEFRVKGGTVTPDPITTD